MSRPEAPRGTHVTRSMLETAIKQVKSKGLQSLRLNDSEEIIMAVKPIRQAHKVVSELERLVNIVYRQLINALITEIRKARRKARKSRATKSSGFLNDKSRTTPTAPLPSTA